MSVKVKKAGDKSLKKLRECSEKLGRNIENFRPKIEEFNRYVEAKKEIDIQILLQENEALRKENDVLKAGKLESISIDFKAYDPEKNALIQTMPEGKIGASAPSS